MNTRFLRRDFLERTLIHIAAVMEKSARAEDLSGSAGFLQRLNPRGKLVGALLLIVAAAVSQRLGVTATLFVFALGLARASAILRPVLQLNLGVLFFTGIIALPALFTTPGDALFHILGIPWPVTQNGLRSASMLVLRVETTAAFAALLTLTTPWPHLLKALRVLRVPVAAILILSMTYRYIFVLLLITRDFFEARRARTVGRLTFSQRRQMSASSAGALLSKSLQLSGEIYEAMLARGFRGEKIGKI